jgi:Mor family transcriptional regulator
VTKAIYKNAVERHPGALQPPFDAILDAHGFDVLYTVCDVLGGETMHIPTSRNMFLGCVIQEIKREYNGYNVRDLARKYGYTSRHVYRLLK